MDTQRLTASLDALSARGPQAARFFYAHLFLSHPELRQLAPISLVEAVTRFGQIVDAVREHLDHPPAVTAVLRHVGREHRYRDVQPEHYEAAIGSALATLAYYNSGSWNAELSLVARRWLEEAARQLAEGLRDAPAEHPPFWTASVENHERRSPRVTVLRLRPHLRLPHLPGQHLPVQTPRWPKVWRHYSIGNAPRPDGTIDLHVRMVDAGPVSSALAWSTRTGDELRLGPPVGEMTLNQASSRGILMVAGSTGLSPLKAILEQLIQQSSTCAVHLFFGADRYADLYELFALRQMANELPWLTLIPVTSQERHPECEFGLLPEVLPRYGRWTEHDSYVCGPAAMVNATRNQLRDLGVPDERVRFDDGRPRPVIPVGNDDRAAVALSVVRSADASVASVRRDYEVD